MKFLLFVCVFLLTTLLVQCNEAEELALTKRLMSILGANRISKRGGVDDATRATILADHNRLRGGVDPAAKNMQKMYWDDKIAVIAQGYADKCPTGHDTEADRAVAGYGIVVGQNMAWGQKSWTEAIEAWYAEVKDFTYNAVNDLGKVGHFTQVVRDVAAGIGCGYMDCPNNQFTETYVCNYAFGNPMLNIQPTLGKPYESGSACGDCPNACVDNLCDCGGKMCLNGGSMDLGSCSCKCTDLYKGDTCSETNCPPSDPDYCGQPQPMGFPAETCKTWSNVPGECPHMCGICSKKRGSADERSSQHVSEIQGRSSRGGKVDYAEALRTYMVQKRVSSADLEDRSSRPALNSRSSRPAKKSSRPALDADERSSAPHLEADERSSAPHLDADERSSAPHMNAGKRSSAPHLDERSSRPALDVAERSSRPALEEKSSRPAKRSSRPSKAARILLELLAADLDADME